MCRSICCQKPLKEGGIKDALTDDAQIRIKVEATVTLTGLGIVVVTALQVKLQLTQHQPLAVIDRWVKKRPKRGQLHFECRQVKQLLCRVDNGRST